jgi:hypothetical protein
MFGLFSLFNRNTALDGALRDVGIHPVLVPEAVKITITRMQKRSGEGRKAEAFYRDAAELLGYCMLGQEFFIESNSAFAADRVEERIEAAVEAGNSDDAQLILLALHSGLMTEDVVERFDLEDDHETSGQSLTD